VRRFGTDNLIRSSAFWGLWNLAAVALVILLPMHIRAGQPLSRLPREKVVQGIAMGAAYLAFSLIVQTRPIRRMQLVLMTGAVASLLCFGTGAGYVLMRPENPSRFVMIFSITLGTVLGLFPILARRFRVFGLVALLVASSGVSLLGFVWPKQESVVNHERVEVIRTALNAIEVTTCHGLLAPVKSDGGGIVKYGDGFLLMTGSGEFYRLEWQAGQNPLKATRLPLPAPMDRALFIADQPEQLKGLRLRTTDIALDTSAVPARIFVAHQNWNHDEKTFQIRVSVAPVPDRGSLPTNPAQAWTVIYNSQPGLPYSKSFDDSETGGRLAWTADGKLLLSLGDHGFDGRSGEAPLAQAPDADYGKVVIVDMKGGRELLSLGHRNPQGLTVDRKGRIWETEHGPQGGDELNLLTTKKNYGWPYQTYGTNYGHTYWPLLVEKDGTAYEKPAHAFVPSIAISNLIELGPGVFSEWDGDLLVGSLRMQSLYRIRLQGDRVAYVEPIRIDRRIRDLEQGNDGRIVLWVDDGTLMVVGRPSRESAGERLFGLCRACHVPIAGGAAALGPPIPRIMGRPVASQSGFAYSPAMKKLGGGWTEDRLDKFLENPIGFCPGTTMKFEGMPDAAERKALIGFLKEYR
jgi:cytochrome c2